MTLLLALACGRYDGGIGVQRPTQEDLVEEIAVAPSLAFSALNSGDAQTAEVLVTNVGTTVVDLVATTSGDAFSVVEVTGRGVRPGESGAVTVQFAPLAPFEHRGTLTVSTALMGDTVEVALTGLGTDPAIDVDPVTLGVATVGCEEAVGEMVVRNVGGQPLQLTGFTSPSPFLWLEGSLGAVAPGGQVGVPLHFVPGVAGPFSTDVVVTSDDPQTPSLSVHVTADAVWPGDVLTASFIAEARTTSVLIALDRSQSMDAELPILTPAFQALIDGIDGVLVDWRLGVVTGEACANGGVIEPGTPGRELAFLEALSGEGSALTESLLALTASAVEAPCNAALLIEGAPLQVVVVSDEPEQSGDPEGSIDRIEAVVGDPWLVHISGVLDVYTVCGDGPDGYLDAIADTNGVLLDVCAATLADHILDLLVPPAYGVDTFLLPSLPVLGSIEVAVDSVPASFLYDAVVQGVRVAPAPPPGALVEVRWHEAGCP